MSQMFLDPKTPLHTCRENSCKGCHVSDNISCHFNVKQLLHFLSIAFPIFLLGGFKLYGYDWKFLILWIGIIIAYFGFVEIRTMCSHCPHYAEPTTKKLKCWANYSSPKLWKYNPGPMSKAEKIVFLAGMATVFLYPVPFLIVLKDWFFLLLYLVLTTSFFYTLHMFLCSRCMNFACPFNNVPEETRHEFFKKNPTVAKAWGKDIT
ncbi:hypothetical protein HZI73_21435 [Vallitalea pronyensis]|uniref:Uncharacterized protein n=1 Tax=Vallitalea pronyensis TaxID=1348613 RepID=A0A8J8SIQ9_9FIRM|nr:hypothetical protein [Vallitalea pronyensis]QUI24704.1 hypothetical protein HZI73_21435 [Vallitalea pronyensis]